MLMLLLVALIWTASAELAQLVLLDIEQQNTGAACLDGTPPAFYIIPGTDDGANKWYLHYEGGGFCMSLEDCYARSLTAFGSSLNYSYTMDLGGGYFSSDPSENPLMYNWNRVFMMYCDGTIYTGDSTVTVDYDGHPLYFRGHYNKEAYYSRLVSSFNLNAGTDFVISGCSAGGIATYYFLDRWRDILPPGAKVRGLPDSGFFMDYEDTTPGKSLADSLRWNFAQSNGTQHLHDACRAAYSNDPVLCAFTSYTAPFITTPMFPLQSQYDLWQLAAIIGTTDPSIVNPFGALLRTTFQNTVLANPKNGCFFDSCYHHCGKWNDIIINGTVVGDAFQAWYESDVGVYVQDYPYPCDACCT